MKIKKSILLFVLASMQFFLGQVVYARGESASDYLKMLLVDCEETVILGSDPYTQRELEKINKIGDRNFMVEKLVNEYVDLSDDPKKLDTAKKFMLEGMKLVDEHFENKTSGCYGIQNEPGFLKVDEFTKKKRFYAYNPDSLNTYMGVLSIQKGGSGSNHGAAVLYEDNNGEYHIKSTAHSFYPEGLSKNIESLTDEAKLTRDKLFDYDLNVIVMKDNSPQSVREVEFKINYNSLNCASTEPTSLNDESIYKDSCDITLSKSDMDKLLNEMSASSRNKPFKLISNEQLQANSDKVIYALVAAGERINGQVIRTVTKCPKDSIKIEGSSIQHKCNTLNHHSGGALVAIIGEKKYLVGIHRGTSRHYLKNADGTKSDVIDLKRSFNRAIRVN